MKRDSLRTNMKYVCGYFEICDPYFKKKCNIQKVITPCCRNFTTFRFKKKPEKAYTWVQYVLGLLVSSISAVA